MKRATNIHKKFSGYGHYDVTLEIEFGEEKITETTTDMQAIDCFDDTESDYYEPCGAIVLAERMTIDREDIDLSYLKELFE